jgi:hypothetical protein
VFVGAALSWLGLSDTLAAATVWQLELDIANAQAARTAVVPFHKHLQLIGVPNGASSSRSLLNDSISLTGNPVPQTRQRFHPCAAPHACPQ